MAGSGGAGALGPALYFMQKEDERLEELRRRNRRRLARKARRAARQEDVIREELDNTEADLGRVLLLAMTVNRLFLQKSLMTSEELAAVARKLDLADGRVDGKLDPNRVRPMAAAPPARSQSPEDFLARLEEKEKDQ